MEITREIFKYSEAVSKNRFKFNINFLKQVSYVCRWDIVIDTKIKKMRESNE